MPFYVLDDNGQNEIIGMYLTSKEAIMKMVRCLKSHNLCWMNTRVIMSDKNFVERLVFGDEFPDARLLLCLFITCCKLIDEKSLVKNEFSVW